jgi:hypothetical protein
MLVVLPGAAKILNRILLAKQKVIHKTELKGVEEYY